MHKTDQFNDALRDCGVPDNQAIATDCRWCHNDGEPHTTFCPLGERSRYIVQHGGPYSILVAKHGKKKADVMLERFRMVEVAPENKEPKYLDLPF